MIYFFRFIFGYVDFNFVGGFCENFLTECFGKGIEIRDVCKTENGFKASCRASTYKKLHHIAYHHGGVVRIYKKHGLPFVAYPLKNRMGLMVGAFAFVLVVSLLNSFVWKVDVVGNNAVSDTSVRSFLELNDFKAGTMWSSVSRDHLSLAMMGEFDEISWVHINRDGGVARVEINEKTPAPDDADEDLLQGNKVLRKELEVAAYRNQLDIAVKSKKIYKKLNFFGIEIPLYINYKKGDISSSSVDFLEIKGVSLPVSIERIEESYVKTKEKRLNDKQLKDLAKKKLNILVEKEFEDFEIINKTEKFKMDDDKCTLSCAYIIRRK